MGKCKALPSQMTVGFMWGAARRKTIGSVATDNDSGSAPIGVGLLRGVAQTARIWKESLGDFGIRMPLHSTETVDYCRLITILTTAAPTSSCILLPAATTDSMAIEEFRELVVYLSSLK